MRRVCGTSCLLLSWPEDLAEFFSANGHLLEVCANCNCSERSITVDGTTVTHVAKFRTRSTQQLHMVELSSAEVRRPLDAVPSPPSAMFHHSLDSTCVFDCGQ